MEPIMENDEQGVINEVDLIKEIKGQFVEFMKGSEYQDNFAKMFSDYIGRSFFQASKKTQTDALKKLQREVDTLAAKTLKNFENINSKHESTSATVGDHVCQITLFERQIRNLDDTYKMKCDNEEARSKILE